MLDMKRCIRCNKETPILECNEAEDWEENLLKEGIAIAQGDIVCDACTEELL